jgi:hypothetical protein
MKSHSIAPRVLGCKIIYLPTLPKSSALYEEMLKDILIVTQPLVHATILILVAALYTSKILPLS